MFCKPTAAVRLAQICVLLELCFSGCILMHEITCVMLARNAKGVIGQCRIHHTWSAGQVRQKCWRGQWRRQQHSGEARSVYSGRRIAGQAGHTYKRHRRSCRLCYKIARTAWGFKLQGQVQMGVCSGVGFVACQYRCSTQRRQLSAPAAANSPSATARVSSAK